MHRIAALSTALMLLAPSAALAADGDGVVPVSSLVLASGGAIVSVLLGLLAWSLKNNVEGFKIAVQQSLEEARASKQRADDVTKEMAALRVEMAKGIRESDVEDIKTSMLALTTSLTALRADVHFLMQSHRNKKEA